MTGVQLNPEKWGRIVTRQSRLLLLFFYFYALRSIRREGQKQEAKNKISTVARGPDHSQNSTVSKYANNSI